ncbi:MAG: hypothetical protein ACMUIE_00205 [Thermoplasmatota archaeon]
MKYIDNEEKVGNISCPMVFSFVTFFFIGCFVAFLISEPYHHEEDEVETLGIKVNLYADVSGPNTADMIEIEIVYGQINWGDYDIKIDTTTLTDTTTSNAGDTLTIATGLPALTQGETYSVIIINIDENKVVWEKDIIAKSYSSAY